MPTLSKSPSKSDLASPSSRPGARLAVNPRRHKVAPDQRKRVATACNNCNVRRIKCSGHKPCQQCSSATRDCEYPEPVVKKTIPEGEYDDLLLVRRCAAEAFAAKHGHIAVDPLSPGERKRADAVLLAFIKAPPAPAVKVDPEAGSTAESSANKMQLDDDTNPASVAPDANFSRSGMVAGDSRGKLLEDDTGTKRYLGTTSGAKYIDSIKDFMAMTSTRISASRDPAKPLVLDTKFLNTRGRYHTFDSRPLKLPAHIDPLELPPPQDRARMLKVVRDCLQDGSPDTGDEFKCGGIFFWPVENVESLERSLHDTASLNPQNLPVTRSHRWLAKFQAAFALATLLTQKAPGSRVEGQPGDVYFERASKLLGNPLDVSNQFGLEDVPALILMALYLLENNRRDNACHYVCMAINVCVEHGANNITPGNLQQQGQQRVFWTLYILDRWVSSLMGRPPYYPDDASSMSIPKPQECFGLPPPTGLQAHVELSEISTYIVRNNLNEPSSVDEVPRFVKQAYTFIREAQAKLQAWKDGLPEPLQVKGEATFAPFEHVRRFPGVDRAVCMLHMAHNQLYILTVRPMFLHMVRTKVARAMRGAVDDEELSSTEMDELREREAMLTMCTAIARNTVELAQTVRHRPNGLLLVQDLHNLFNAAIILTLNQMYSVNLMSSDTAGITEAIGLFEAEALTGNAYCVDCTEVLKDLRRLVLQLRPAIFEGVRIQSPPEPKLVPGEGILASHSPLGAGSGAEMDLDPPALPLHGRGVSDAHPGVAVGGSPAPPADLVSKAFERWESTHAMSLYINGSCMVDM